MSENSQKIDETFVRNMAETIGRKLLRDDGLRYSLIDNSTGEIAFENSAADCTLEQIFRMLVVATGFEFDRAVFGLGRDPGLFIDEQDDEWKPSHIYACLVAAHFAQALIPASGFDDFLAIDIATFERWVKQARKIFALPGLLRHDETGRLASYANYGSRLLGARSRPDDGERAQGFTVVCLPPVRVLVGFGSVGTIIGMASMFEDKFLSKLANIHVARTEVAAWFEREEIKCIPSSHPGWEFLPSSALATYKILTPGIL
jgi:hypothetical protein